MGLSCLRVRRIFQIRQDSAFGRRHRFVASLRVCTTLVGIFRLPGQLTCEQAGSAPDDKEPPVGTGETPVDTAAGDGGATITPAIS